MSVRVFLVPLEGDLNADVGGEDGNFAAILSDVVPIVGIGVDRVLVAGPDPNDGRA